MTLEILDLIEKIENQIGHQYLGGCIGYIDNNYDQGWSKAMDRFENALTQRPLNEIKIMTEAAIYKATCLQYIKTYKAERDYLETGDLFSQLKKQVEDQKK